MYILREIDKRLALVNLIVYGVPSVDPVEKLELDNVPRCKRRRRDISQWLGIFVLFKAELANAG